MKLSSLNKDEHMVHYKGRMQKIRNKYMQRQKISVEDGQGLDTIPVLDIRPLGES